MYFVVNFVVFQVGWLASVIGGAQMLPWVGPAVTAVAIAIHLTRAGNPANELMLVLSCGLLGAVFDSALVALGWVTYPSGMLSDNLAPYWIVTMWMLFATTLNVSLRWLRGRPAISAVLGLVAGPLSYYAGLKLGGIAFVDVPAATAALGIGWAVMLPALIWLAEEFDGMEPVVGETASS